MPISKNQADLYAQFHILDWRILGYKTYWSFAANHIEFDPEIPQKIIRCLNTDYLARKISPYTVQGDQKGLPCPSRQKLFRKLFFPHPEAERTLQSGGRRPSFSPERAASGEHLPAFCRTAGGYQRFPGVLFQRSDTGYEHIVTQPFFENPADNPRLQRLLSVIDNRSKYIIFCNYTYEIDGIMPYFIRQIRGRTNRPL